MTLQQGRDQRRAKTRLFCQRCDHESPIDGDWISDDRTARQRLRCPRCGEPVVDRPRV